MEKEDEATRIALKVSLRIDEMLIMPPMVYQAAKAAIVYDLQNDIREALKANREK